MSDTSDTRERIIDAAQTLIYGSSYTDVGVAAICEHAGVQKGSFYHFFPSKRDLTLAVLDAYFLNAKQQVIDHAFTQDRPPLERLDALVALTVEMQQQLQAQTGHVLGCPFGNLASELSTQDEPIRAAIVQIMRRFQVLLTDTLQQALDRGDLSDIDPGATAQAMLAYLEGVLLLAKNENDTEVIRRLLPALRQIRVPARPQ
jgi:TetR/AcrR family transcriptional repressor of nem operon